MQATLSPWPTHSSPLKHAPSREPSSLYTWGANKNGELGHGDSAKRAVPRCVKHFKSATSTSIFAVSISATHALALSEFRVRAPGALPRLGCAESKVSTPNHSLGAAAAAAATSAIESEGGRVEGTRRRKQTHKVPFMGGSSGGSHSGGHEKKTAEEIVNLRRKKAQVLERKASEKKEKTKGRGGGGWCGRSDVGAPTAMDQTSGYDAGMGNIF